MNDQAHSRFDPAAKLALAPQFARYMAGKKVYPVGLEISPSGTCTATCSFCWYSQGAAGSHRKVFLETDRVVCLLSECITLRIKAITWTGGGDPALHPDIEGFVRLAFVSEIRQGMFTNALVPPRYDPRLLDWIRVTMTDRPFKVDYIKPLRAAKTLGFAFNYAGPQDLLYLEDTLALAEVVQADYVQARPALKFRGETVDIEPPPLDHPLLYVTDYKFEEAKKKHGYARCEGYHFTPFIWETGDVDVCAYMREYPGYTLGNIYQDSLKAILDRAPVSVPVHEHCQVCCKLHETNKFIHHCRSLEDVNFP